MTAPNNPGTIPELLMSDSSQTRWSSTSTFSDTDLGGPKSVEPTGLNPVLLTIAGSLENPQPYHDQGDPGHGEG